MLITSIVVRTKHLKDVLMEMAIFGMGNVGQIMYILLPSHRILLDGDTAMFNI